MLEKADFADFGEIRFRLAVNEGFFDPEALSAADCRSANPALELALLAGKRLAASRWHNPEYVENQLNDFVRGVNS